MNKEKDRNKEYKEKIKDKTPKKSLSPVPPKDIRKEENVKKPPEENNKDRITSKTDIVKEKKHKEKKHKEERERKENHKDHDKKENDKDKINEKTDKKLEIPKDKEIKEIKFKTLEKEEKKSKQDREKDRNHDSEKHKHKHKRKEKHRKEDDKDRRKKRPREKTPEPIPPPKVRSPTPPSPHPPILLSSAPVKSTTINPLNMLIQELSDKDSDSDFSVCMDEDTKSDPPLELLHKSKMDMQEEREKNKKRDKKNRDEDRECRKRKKRTKDKDEPFEKLIKTEIKEEPIDISPKREERSESPETLFTEDYMTQLKDLQQKIMTIQDNAELQRVVQVISETGHFEITQRTFDFDLCALDRNTVKRLQDMFITAS